MVLKLIAIISLVSCIIFNDEGPMLDKYENKLRKEIKKSFKTAEDINFVANTQSSFLEQYDFFIDNIETGKVYIKEVKSCNLNGCSTSDDANSKLNAEYFDMLVITDTESNIKRIKILNYFSDYGYEISSRKYLKQFKKFKLCDFSTQNPQVDGMTGATVSYNALIASLEEFCIFSQE